MDSFLIVPAFGIGDLAGKLACRLGFSKTTLLLVKRDNRHGLQTHLQHFD